MVVHCERVAACDNIIVFKANRHGINTDTRAYIKSSAGSRQINNILSSRQIHLSR